jgi:hypothetical protein
MSRENPTWGAPRIHSELIKLGIQMSEASVAKYMIRSRKPPSQTCRYKLHQDTELFERAYGYIREYY